MSDIQVSFNLVDEPWIKVIALDGKNKELSLKGLFHEAHSLRALANDVATQDFAILRMLLAILQRSVAELLDEYDYPSEAWGALWDAKHMPVNEIDAYLSKWHHRFDLFDCDVPFMQVAGMQATNGKVSDTRPLLSKSKNKPSLFPQLTLSGLTHLTYSEAARWLINVQSFDPSGIRAGVVQSSGEKEERSTPIGPSWAGGIGGVYLEGQNLFETLMLNLCLCYDCRDDPDEFIDTESDLPVWEQPQKRAMRDARRPNGYADLYTWQSRRVLLREEYGKVNGVVLTNGDKLEVYNERRNEPMTSWRRNNSKESVLNIKPVYTPVQHKTAQSMWRGLPALLPWLSRSINERLVVPGILLWVAYLTSANGGKRINPRSVVRVHAVGYDFADDKKTNIRELVNDVLYFHAYLISPQGVDAIELAIDCMEATEQAVRALGRLAERIELASGVDSRLPSNTREEIEAEAYYELDSEFRTWLSRLAPDSLCERRADWYTKARRLIKTLGQKLVDNACPAALPGRKVTKNGDKSREDETKWMSAGKAEAQFKRDLARVLPENIDEQKEGEVE